MSVLIALGLLTALAGGAGYLLYQRLLRAERHIARLEYRISAESGDTSDDLLDLELAAARIVDAITRAADEAVERLEAARSSASRPNNGDAPEDVAETVAVAATNATLAVERGSAAPDFHAILTLAERGASRIELAKRAGLSPAELDLMLRLGKRTQSIQGEALDEAEPQAIPIAGAGVGSPAAVAERIIRARQRQTGQGRADLPAGAFERGATKRNRGR